MKLEDKKLKSDNIENKNEKNIKVFAEFVGGKDESSKKDLIEDKDDKNRLYSYKYREIQLHENSLTNVVTESVDSGNDKDNDFIEETESRARVKKTFKNERKRSKKKSKGRLLKKLILTILLVALILLGMKFSYFNISTISVNGNNQLSKEAVTKESGINIGDNIFFFGKGKAIDRLKKNPIFKEVKINRTLPNQLTIEVEERVGKIVIAYGEKYILVDEEGVLISLVNEKPKLSEIQGITIKNMDKAEVVEVKEKDNFEKALTLITESEKSDIFFQFIEMGDEIKLTVYGNLYVKGKYEHILRNIKNGKLKKIIADLYAKEISRGTIKIDSKSDMSFTPIFE